ncbi:MAG: NADH-quinone oxidoreductase subunit J, partial [Methanococcoides sp.]|jgi:F420H2 dehydrogenase subunit J|uniref:NADH-quinone oxidoreductase subunit J n=2 Tax=Methanococcoides TaxID=2225 RepID=A0A9E5DBC7_9EURY|nr:MULTISPECIES: NADH-quinone oxidoreductase subunit J [Methanococcoides]MCD4801066.1 NADH-quinone oxidoreductase subunit J [Methanococcoides sp.]MCD4807270.1 NADH-quinone oxidoreductase subunit J [Methanococcoides sp.]MCM1986233.1 NADH-quinone oxidoreductase subunit J [Methanococcoides seepicolus]MDA0525136.1 NADH-quinone oxidoreductase subunit J [Methanococcoides alaskense]
MVSEMVGIIEGIIFLIVALVLISFAILSVVTRDIVRAALALIISMFTVAAVYIMLNAQFLGVVQILVYVGAIGVLILFAVMLTKKTMGRENND